MTVQQYLNEEPEQQQGATTNTTGTGTTPQPSTLTLIAFGIIAYLIYKSARGDG